MFTLKVRSLAISALFGAACIAGALSAAQAGPRAAVSPSTIQPQFVQRMGSGNPMMEHCVGPVTTTYAWEQVNANPLEFAEFFYNFYWNGSWQQCGGGEVVNTTCVSGSPNCPTRASGPPPTPGNLINEKICTCITVTVALMKGSSSQGALIVGKATTKGLQTIGTLDVGSGVLAVDDALDPSGTFYASAQAQSPSEGTTGVYLFAGGATEPTTVLPAPSGLNAAGLAVDAKHDVFWAGNPAGGSQGGILFEYPSTPSGYGSAKEVFATSSPLGDVLLTNKGLLVVSLPNAGVIEILTPSGQVVGKIATGGTPQSIRLNKSQKNLTVVDTTNELLETYSFPQGTLLQSGTLTVNGQQLMPIGASQRD